LSHWRKYTFKQRTNMSASFLSFYHANFTCKLWSVQCGREEAWNPHVDVYLCHGAHNTCMNDVSIRNPLYDHEDEYGFWEALFTRLLPTSTVSHVRAPTASSSFSTAGRWFCTTTNHNISVYKQNMLSFALIMFILFCTTSMYVPMHISMCDYHDLCSRFNHEKAN